MAIGRLLGHLNRIDDANGNPLSGGKVYVYRAGTSTLATIYTTSAADTASTNPVVADSGGLLAAIWADDTAVYDVHVKTAGDVSVQQIANVVPVGAVQDSETADEAARADRIARARSTGLQFNGLCEISQERAGTVTPGVTGGTPVWVVDGWVLNALGPTVTGQRVTAPFPSFAEIGYGVEIVTTVAKATLSATDRVVIGHVVEGYKSRGLGFGTARARALSIGFIVRPSIDLVGYVTFRNTDQTRSYIKRFSAPANTDTLVTFSGDEAFPGCTDGVWDTTGGRGFDIALCFGAGVDIQGEPDIWHASNVRAGSDVTNMAAVVGTSVRVSGLLVVPGRELPTAADWSLCFPSQIAELQECQRYYEKSFLYDVVPASNTGTTAYEWDAFPATVAGAAINRSPSFKYRVNKRTAPTVTTFNPAAASAEVHDLTLGSPCSGTMINTSAQRFIVTCTANASTAVGNRLIFNWVADARLS